MALRILDSTVSCLVQKKWFLTITSSITSFMLVYSRFIACILWLPTLSFSKSFYPLVEAL